MNHIEDGIAAAQTAAESITNTVSGYNISGM